MLLTTLDDEIAKLATAAIDEVAAQGFAPHAITTNATVHLRYQGTDTALAVAIRQPTPRSKRASPRRIAHVSASGTKTAS